MDFKTPRQLDRLITSYAMDFTDVDRELKDEREEARAKASEIVKEAVGDQDSAPKIYCIKIPTGLGKSWGIQQAIVDHPEIGFTVFMKSHKQMKEYAGELTDSERFGDKALSAEDYYIHRGRSQDSCGDMWEDIESAYQRDVDSLWRICQWCQRKSECDHSKGRTRRRLASTRVVLVAHNLFPLIAKGRGEETGRRASRSNRRLWNGNPRIFVVEENYFDSIRMPLELKVREVDEFKNALFTFCEEKQLETNQLEENQLGENQLDALKRARRLCNRIQNCSLRPNERYRIIKLQRSDPDFEFDEGLIKKWNDWFSAKHSWGTASNLLMPMETALRYGAHVSKGPRSETRYTIYLPTNVKRCYRMPRLTNRLIILDATFRDDKEYLSESLSVPKEKIVLKEETFKSKSLYLVHYPYSNASRSQINTRSTSADIKAKVTRWLQAVADRDNTPFNKHFCVLYNKPYKETAKGALEPPGTDKARDTEFFYFHYGDETGLNVAETSTNAIVIGKLQISPHQIQALFLDKLGRSGGLGRKDLNYRVDSSGLHFNHPLLEEENRYQSFRSSYQGASRARFANSICTVHFLCKDDILETQWKEVLLDPVDGKIPNYYRCNDPTFRKIFFPDDVARLEAAKEILRDKKEVCAKDIAKELNQSPRSVWDRPDGSNDNQWSGIKEFLMTQYEAKLEKRGNTEYLVQQEENDNGGEAATAT